MNRIFCEIISVVKYPLFFVFLILISNPVFSQHGDADLKHKAEEINRLCEQADTLSPFDEEFDLIDSVNTLLAEKLSELLSDKNILFENIDSLLDNGFLQVATSSDKKLTIISWYENTGGTFQSALQVTAFMGSDGKQHVAENSDGSVVPVSGLWTGEIFLLQGTQNIYLLMEGARTCTSCEAYYAETFVLTDSGMVSYPAFENAQEGDSYHEKTDGTFGIDARTGDVAYFNFDADKQEINYSYMLDDLNGGDIDDVHQATVSGILHFDGQKFVPVKE